MMGDNRHNSIDARAWGLVPFTHVVGKPVFIWMSWNSFGQGFDKIRWERMFTTVNGSGEASSYFIPFIIILIGFIVFNKWWEKNKSKQVIKIVESEKNYASVTSRIKSAIIDSIILI